MELALEAKKCQLDIVGLASMHSLGFGACRGAGLYTTLELLLLRGSEQCWVCLVISSVS